QVETQLAVLRSEKIANMVIDEMDLVDNPEFTSLKGEPLSVRFEKLLALLGLAGAKKTTVIPPEPAIITPDEGDELDPQFETRRHAIWNFGDGLRVTRAGVSYAIDIWFQARDPGLAAEIANATAAAFVREQLEIRTESASEGLRWLEAR